MGMWLELLGQHDKSHIALSWAGKVLNNGQPSLCVNGDRCETIGVIIKNPEHCGRAPSSACMCSYVCMHGV